MFRFHLFRLRTNNYRLILPALIKIATVAGILFSILSGVAAAANKSPQEEIFFKQKKMLVDFDEMVQHNTVRALVAYSKTFYFLDRGRQYGICNRSPDYFGKSCDRHPRPLPLMVYGAS